MTAAVLDFEAAATHTVRVRVTDADGTDRSLAQRHKGRALAAGLPVDG